MRIRVLESATGGDRLQTFATTFLVDGALAVDAGCLGFWRTPAEQARIADVLLTHSHADHLASLPMFLENVHGLGERPVRVHGSAETIACLRRDLFNDRVWPDLERIGGAGAPFLELREHAPREPFAAGGLRVTAIPVDHVVPTSAFLVEGGEAAALFVSDTGPTEEVWRVANGVERLRAVFLEASFPDSQGELARVSKHLTPSLFARETEKLRAPVTWVAVHQKARWREEIERELLELGVEGLELGRPGRELVL